MKNLLIYIAVGCASAIADQQPAISPQPRGLPSPDGRLIASIESKRGTTTEDTVRFSTRDHKTLLAYSMTSETGWNGRLVLQAQWSPDSQFFVFSTFSAGGHSSWNFRTFAYSTAANQVVSIDDRLRPVTNEKFRLRPPHLLEIELLAPGGTDFPSETKTVDLQSLFDRPTRWMIK